MNPNEFEENQNNTSEQQENKAEPNTVVENQSADQSNAEIEKLQSEVLELKDKHLRLYSEFENFRRRSVKEKLEQSKTANEEVLSALLPVLDDFERAMKVNQDPGVELIYNKLFRLLEAKGLKPMKTIGEPFNSEFHEAITQAPAPSDDLKGKVIDEVERGYYLNEKVIRFAKVIIGI